MRETRIHWLTLRFDDHVLESQIKASMMTRFRTLTFAATVMTLIILVCLVLGGFGGRLITPVIISLISISFCLLLVWLCDEYPSVTRLMPASVSRLLSDQSEFHARLCQLGSILWLICLATWWRMTLQGTFTRIRPDDSVRVLGCCALWVAIQLGLHFFLFPFSLRLLVQASAVPIIVSGAISQMLFMALGLGELFGYIFELQVRTDFLEKTRRLEQLASEKERMMYELQMSRQHQDALVREHERLRLTLASRTSHESEHSDSLSDDGRRDLPSIPIGARYARSESSKMSFGTDSEVVILTGARRTASVSSSDAGSTDGHAIVDDQVQSVWGRVSAFVPMLNSERFEALWRTLEDSGIDPHED